MNYTMATEYLHQYSLYLRRTRPRVRGKELPTPPDVAAMQLAAHQYALLCWKYLRDIREQDRVEMKYAREYLRNLSPCNLRIGHRTTLPEAWDTYEEEMGGQ